MIRDGLFGQDYGMKLILTLIGLTVCIIFWYYTKKNDYFIVFLAGIVIWSSYELMISISGIRSLTPTTLFGQDLHWILACILRGSSEGSVVAIVGIIFGDYIPNPNSKTRNIAILSAVLLIFWFVSRTILNGLPFRNIGGVVASRRDVFAWLSVLFFVIIAIFNILWYIKEQNELVKIRARNMFISILIFSTIWTLAQYIANVRWVEVYLLSGYIHASPFIEFLVFAWDIVFEVSLCYVSFFTIPYSLKIINSRKRNPLSVTDSP